MQNETGNVTNVHVSNRYGIFHNLCDNCDNQICLCTETNTGNLENLVTRTISGETRYESHSNSFDTILDSNNGSIYEKDTVYDRTCDVLETSIFLSHDASNMYRYTNNADLNFAKSHEVGDPASNIYETLTLCDSKSDLSLGSLSSNANENENDLSSNFNALKDLQFASLNVCGLKRRVLFPEFSDLVSKYDLFCVCETKLDKYDVIDMPGYVFHSQCRKQKYIRKSGGIGIFIKQTLSPHVSIIESDSDFV